MALPTIGELVAEDEGVEKLPRSNKPSWNADVALALIKHYDEGYSTDEDAIVTSPKRKIAVAKHLGVTRPQLYLALSAAN